MSLDVHNGHDGWLFLAGGSNEVLRYFADETFFDTAKPLWIELLRQRSAQAGKRGIIYRHMTVPDKLSIYTEYYGADLAFPESAPSTALPELVSSQDDSDHLVPLLVNVRSTMLDAKNSSDALYWKTDAHWTFEGCWQGYLALCESVGAKPNSTILDAPTTTGELYLDLGSKLNPPVSEQYVVKHFIKGAERTFANLLVEYKERENAHDAPGLHVGSQVSFKNTTTATDTRKIVIFGDSYSEYRTHQLTGLLAETFAETHFVWNGAIDWNFVDRVRADIVVTEMAERFHNLVPVDNLNIDDFARQRLNDYKATKFSQ